MNQLSDRSRVPQRVMRRVEHLEGPGERARHAGSKRSSSGGSSFWPDTWSSSRATRRLETVHERYFVAVEVQLDERGGVLEARDALDAVVLQVQVRQLRQTLKPGHATDDVIVQVEDAHAGEDRRDNVHLAADVATVQGEVRKSSEVRVYGLVQSALRLRLGHARHHHLAGHLAAAGVGFARVCVLAHDAGGPDDGTTDGGRRDGDVTLSWRALDGGSIACDVSIACRIPPRRKFLHVSYDSYMYGRAVSYFLKLKFQRLDPQCFFAGRSNRRLIGKNSRSGPTSLIEATRSRRVVFPRRTNLPRACRTPLTRARTTLVPARST